MKIKFTDTGEITEAENAKELVDKMRQGSHVKSTDNKDYMLGYSRRAVMYADEDVRANSEEDFVKDLLRLKHIVLV